MERRHLRQLPSRPCPTSLDSEFDEAITTEETLMLVQRTNGWGRSVASDDEGIAEWAAMLQEEM